MNPTFFGDSYDLVKRFFCRELESLGYFVVIDPMLTGSWDGREHEFYRLVGVTPDAKQLTSTRSALLLDPDTGINEKGGSQHVSFDRLAQEASKYEVVFRSEREGATT